MKDLKNNIKFFKLTTLILLAVVLLGILFPGKLFNRFCPKVDVDLTQKAKPTAETQLEKSFELTAKKNTQDKFKINVIKADKVELVTTKNQPIVAKEGEEFLLLYLEIKNDQEYPIVLDTKSYFRLLKDDKKLAPDLYNGEIQIDAISSKNDNVGFVVAKGEKNFQVQVGELSGKKEIIDIQF